MKIIIATNDEHEPDGCLLVWLLLAVGLPIGVCWLAISAWLSLGGG